MAPRVAHRMEDSKKLHLPLVIFGPPKGCSMMTLRPAKRRVSRASPRAASKSRESLTLRTERNADSVCEDIDTLEDARAALVGELDFLVGTALQCRLSSLRSGSADSRGRRGGETVHGSGESDGERTRTRARAMRGEEEGGKETEVSKSTGVRFFGDDRAYDRFPTECSRITVTPQSHPCQRIERLFRSPGHRHILLTALRVLPRDLQSGPVAVPNTFE